MAGSEFNKRLDINMFGNLSLNILNEVYNQPLDEYKKTSSNIEVVVRPIFLETESSSKNNYYVWLYHITITNNSKQPVKLIKRYWKAINNNGGINEVYGDGVIGQTPTIKAGESFEYASGTHLDSKSGVMFGYFEVENSEKEIKKIDIPMFSLDSEEQINTPN